MRGGLFRWFVRLQPFFLQFLLLFQQLALLFFSFSLQSFHVIRTGKNVFYGGGTGRVFCGGRIKGLRAARA